VFPVEDIVPESKRHLLLRTLLFQLLKYHFADRACVGSDQFVYWNARDPKRSLAPDVFLRMGTKDDTFDSWKTWERGTPELAIEIVSESDAKGSTWDDKLERYHELGVTELVRFDSDAPEGHRLTVWDRLENDLVERRVEADATPVVTLGLRWIVSPDPELAAVLRLSRDQAGKELLLTREEVAEQRIRVLEAELDKRSS